MTDEIESRAGGTEEPGGYVHDPATFNEDGERDANDVSTNDPPAGSDQDREFSWRGWVLIGFTVVAFVVVPTMLYYVPRARGFVTSLGLSLRDAYLVLPLLPALLLGALAVWATTRP